MFPSGALCQAIGRDETRLVRLLSIQAVFAGALPLSTFLQRACFLDLSGTKGGVNSKLRAVDCRDELKRPILYGNN
jgi:hypothetical protein